MLSNRSFYVGKDINAEKVCEKHPLYHAILRKNYNSIFKLLYFGADFEKIDLNDRMMLCNTEGCFDIIKLFKFKIPNELFQLTYNKDLIDYGLSQGLTFKTDGSKYAEFYKAYRTEDFSNVNIVNESGESLLEFAFKMADQNKIKKLKEIRAPFYVTAPIDVVSTPEVVTPDVVTPEVVSTLDAVSTVFTPDVASPTTWEIIKSLISPYSSVPNTKPDDDSFVHVDPPNADECADIVLVTEPNDNLNVTEPNVNQDSSDDELDQPEESKLFDQPEESSYSIGELSITGDLYAEMKELNINCRDFVRKIFDGDDIVKIIMLIRSHSSNQYVNIIDTIKDEKIKSSMKKLFL